MFPTRDLDHGEFPPCHPAVRSRINRGSWLRGDYAIRSRSIPADREFRRPRKLTDQANGHGQFEKRFYSRKVIMFGTGSGALVTLVEYAL